MRRRAAARGFTIIELMIGLGIVALLMAIGLPAFRDLLANAKIRNTAEALQAGLQLARSEAITRNRPVQFLLFGDEDYTPAQAGLVTENTAGPHWLIRVQDPTTLLWSQIEWKSGYEGSNTSQDQGSPGVVVAATYPGMAVGFPANIITFKGLGGTGLGGTAQFDVSNPGVGACNALGTPGPMRCLRVTVSVSGQVRLCDPSVASTDTRAC